MICRRGLYNCERYRRIHIGDVKSVSLKKVLLNTYAIDSLLIARFLPLFILCFDIFDFNIKTKKVFLCHTKY